MGRAQVGDRLQVARALIARPKVLVLDEPTTGLDPGMRRSLWEILIAEREQGTAILLSTHYMQEAERLCDRVALLDKGVIRDLASPRTLIERHDWGRMDSVVAETRAALDHQIAA